jgi:hypothetical protein
VRRKGLRIAAVVLLGIGGTFYFLFIARAHERREKDGWTLDWSYIRLRCRHCFGEIERLEYAGKPVHPPALGPDSCVVFVWTPVGAFTDYPGLARWWYDTLARPVSPVDPAITAEDLARGWYEMAEPYRSGGQCQRAGTPAHWCLVAGAHARWCEPQRIAECAAAVSAIPATQTAPAAESRPESKRRG